MPGGFPEFLNVARWLAAWPIVGLSLLGSLAWIWFFVEAARHHHRVLRLGALGDERPAHGWPSVALVFAARDEAPVIEPATRSMLAIDYPDLAIVAVDDRSGDETGDILDRLARESAALHVLHIKELPGGWLGKTYALERAVADVSAEWILLTDADVHFEPGALRRAVVFAQQHNVDHVAVAPTVITRSIGERLFLAVFQAGISMYAPAWSVADRRSRAAVGIGAFNLVRREGLMAIGGFKRLALSVDEDMQLGKALKWSGRESRLVLAENAVSVRWHEGVAGLIRGLEKNFFAGAGYSVPRALFFLFGCLTVGAGPAAGLFFGPLWSRAVAAMAVAASMFLLEQIGKQSGIRWFHAALLPIGAVLNSAALARSTWLTLARGGVVWRNQLYPLTKLREHVRQRDAWLRELWKSTR